MTEFLVKSLLLGKDNEPDGRQDALAVNNEQRLFAVADGVSNSFRPDVVAQALCSIFTGLDPEGSELDDWESFSDELLLPEISRIWSETSENYLSGLSGRILRHEIFNLERWGFGAATFCGVAIDRSGETLRYYVIGDSTLFVIYTDGSNAVINTCRKDENEEEDVAFSNRTSAVTTDNCLAGRWLTGTLRLDGIKAVALMTDGMAVWFYRRLRLGLDPFGILWSVETPEEFAAFADSQRSASYEMDDDLAAILIRPSAEPSAASPEAIEPDAVKPDAEDPGAECCDGAEPEDIVFEDVVLEEAIPEKAKPDTKWPEAEIDIILPPLPELPSDPVSDQVSDLAFRPSHGNSRILSTIKMLLKSL